MKQLITALPFGRNIQRRGEREREREALVREKYHLHAKLPKETLRGAAEEKEERYTYDEPVSTTYVLKVKSEMASISMKEKYGEEATV